MEHRGSPFREPRFFFEPQPKRRYSEGNKRQNPKNCPDAGSWHLGTDRAEFLPFGPGAPSQEAPMTSHPRRDHVSFK